MRKFVNPRIKFPECHIENTVHGLLNSIGEATIGTINGYSPHYTHTQIRKALRDLEEKGKIVLGTNDKGKTTYKVSIRED